MRLNFYLNIFLVRLVRPKNRMLPHLCPTLTILTLPRETSALKSFAIKKHLLVQGQINIAKIEFVFIANSSIFDGKLDIGKL